MAPDPDKTPDPEQAGPQPDGDAHAGPPVPFYGVSGAPVGIQAFRRGDVILYTVRGEPAEVQELMGQLEGQGVGEVMALISHHADDVAPAEPDLDVDVDVEDKDE